MKQAVSGVPPSRGIDRPTLLTILLFGAGVAIVLGVFWEQLQRDRAALASRIEADRLDQVDEVVRLVASDVGDVVEDLVLISKLTATLDTEADRSASLGALLASVKAYRAAVLYEGTVQTTIVTDPRRPGELDEEVHEAIAATARLAARAGGTIVSPPLERGGEWARVLARQDEEGRIVLLVVDTAAWLSGLKMVSSDPRNHVLVLGPGGAVAPATDPLVRDLATKKSSAEFGGLLERMRRGERGTARFESAELEGFEPGDVVVAFASVEVPGAAHWSLAVFTSTADLKTQEDALATRFEGAAAGVLVLLIGFVAYVVIGTRRRAVLLERLRHADELAEVNEQLLHAEKLATVGGLAAGIAHEVGTPLGVVRGRAEYVLRKLGDDHPQAGSLKTIAEQIDRVTRIIQELLDFARPRSAEGRATSLAEVCQRVRELLTIELERAEVSLVVAIPEDLPLLAADPDQLQQVLVNLCINARDALTDTGGHVRVTARAAAGVVVIEVADDGPGIPADIVHRVFDPFFTTKKRGQGTGLGLSVVSQIVRSHRGEVTIDSDEEHGTVVSIRWPTHVAERGEG